MIREEEGNQGRRIEIVDSESSNQPLNYYTSVSQSGPFAQSSQHSLDCSIDSFVLLSRETSSIRSPRLFAQDQVVVLCILKEGVQV